MYYYQPLQLLVSLGFSLWQPGVWVQLSIPSQQLVFVNTPVPEFIDPVFTKTSLKRSFSLNRKRAFWLVFAKTGSIISGTAYMFPLRNLFITVRRLFSEASACGVL
jgi:hypothetical protein